MSAPFSEFGPFAVGEICRIVRSDSYQELIGREVEIRSLPQPCHNNAGEKWLGYGTNIKNYTPPESYLRRRRPPAADSNERMYVQKWRDMAGKAPQRVGETV